MWVQLFVITVIFMYYYSYNNYYFSVWLEINNRLAALLNVWYEPPEPIYKVFLNFQRQLVYKLVSRLGWEYSDSDTYLTTMLRTLVIRMAGRADDEEYAISNNQKIIVNLLFNVIYLCWT